MQSSLHGFDTQYWGNVTTSLILVPSHYSFPLLYFYPFLDRVSSLLCSWDSLWMDDPPASTSEVPGIIDTCQMSDLPMQTASIERSPQHAIKSPYFCSKFLVHRVYDVRGLYHHHTSIISSFKLHERCQRLGEINQYLFMSHTQRERARERDRDRHTHAERDLLER